MPRRSRPGRDESRAGSARRDGIVPHMDVSTSAKVPHAEFFPPPPSPRGPSLWLARLAEDRRQLVRFWPVIQNMVVQELRVRYQRSILGFVWTLLNPLLMMATLGFGLLPPDQGRRELSALPVRRHGALELPEQQPERLRDVHHRQRGADPEDLPAEAGLPAGAGADQPGDVRASRWARMFLLLWPLGARPSLADAAPAAGDRAVRGLHARAWA